MLLSGEQLDVATVYDNYKAMYKEHAATSSASASANISTSTVNSALKASQNAEGPVKSKRPNRLPENALSIMRDYYYMKNAWPNMDEKRELLRRIHEIPGTDWYTVQSVNSWFNGRRVADKMTKKRDITASILWPSLDNGKIQKLRILHEQRPPNVPLSKLVGTWARALGAEAEHVQAWVDYHDPSDEASHLVDRKHTPHLPTPEATASPEPNHLHMSRSPTATTQPPPILPPFSTTSPIVKQQQLSPVQPYFVPPYIQSSVEPQSPVTSQALFVPFRPQLHVHASQLPTPPAYSSPTHTSAQPGPDVKVAVSDISPLPPISASQPMPLPRTNMLKDLAVTLNDAKSSLPQEVTLTSLEDIDRAFEPYEKMMRDLLSKARSGLFAPVGLDPAIVTSVSDDDDTSDDNMDISQ